MKKQTQSYIPYDTTPRVKYIPKAKMWATTEWIDKKQKITWHEKKPI